MQLSDFIDTVRVTNSDELLAELVRYTRRMEFQTITATAVIDHVDGSTEFIGVDNAPPAYRDIHDDRADWRRDPVTQRCRRSGAPLVWNQHTYTSSGLGAMWEQQAAHGYRTGIVLALHLPGQRHLMIGVDRDRPLPIDEAAVARMTADLVLLTVCIQDAALRLLAHQPTQLVPPCLTQA